jgi:hypothetical protein
MSDFRLSDAFGGSAAKAVSGLLLAAVLLAPGAANAAIFGSPAPAAAASSLAFKTAPGSVGGRWAYRSIAISGDPKALMTKLALGSGEFDLTEAGGKITGTRPGAAKGETYPVTGFVVYGPRKAPQIVLHSTSDVNGKTYEYDYFGYLMPSWNVSGGAQADTIMGTVVRTDPSAPEAAAIVVSFIATRESAGAALPSDASKPADAPKPAKPAKPKPAKPAADAAPAAAPADAAPAAPAAPAK